MVLASMNLPHGATDAWLVLSNDNKQVFALESHVRAILHDFNMSEVLPVGTDFILAFDNQDSPVSQDTMRFP